MQLNTVASNAGEVEQISPDLLKNTDSNIRRLADEIQQSEGRQKYLAQTRSPSDGGDVRWYFSKIPLGVNELAASVPQTEIVGKSDYFRFGMRDSLAVEATFLQVDLVKRHCFPVYWNGENRRVLRGHWFARKGGLDCLPLREDVAEQLEYAYRSQVWHRRSFQPSGLFAARVDLQGSTTGLHALFTGEDDTWEAWLGVDASGFLNVVGFGRNGIKLRRGYAASQSPKPTKCLSIYQEELRQQKEEEMDDYCSQVPVRHLVFMVHGIGQRLANSNLVDDVANFRHVTASLAERHLTLHQLGTQRVLFIPCQWRKGLMLSGEAAVEKITLDGVRGLRTTLSATVHDILYYMSPIYCQDIIDSVSNQLNRLYLKFLKRNPGYEGKVSLFGHSLGSVLSYDILCHQETLSSPFPMEWMYKTHSRSETSYLHSNELTSILNLGDENSVDIKCKSMLGPEEKENTQGEAQYQDFVEEPREGSYDPVISPASSESDELTTTDGGPQQTNDASSSDKNVDEPSVDWKPIASYKCEMMNDPNSIKSSLYNKNDDAPFDSNNAETIKSLREEIVLLKAKVKEFESGCANSGEKTTGVNQPDPERVLPKPSDSLKTNTLQIRYTKLEFKVDTFFAVGSPLGVFLALRNVRIGIGKAKEYWEAENINEEMPTCQQMFNIFHPFDPVAYRIEPLICKEFIDQRPIIIPYHRGGKRLYIGFQEFKEGLSSGSQALMNHLNTARVKVLTFCESGGKNDCDEELENPKEERSYGSIMMERLTGSEDGRIDHILQDKTFRHPYLSVLSSHTNYWRDHDTALFILKHLYRDIPEEPLSPSEHLEGSSRDGNNFEGWSNPRELADDELPLTFADSIFIKRISSRLKKSMKH
ncbi:phospholipase SGR2-like isoform X4 [Olea europaea var. sylvestris]|uniref:phospholipase SGR2-like isoform X4 n=1 Tax=Olea europaea var. sylvestris TaxID=158386 RepID=UPI000C1CFEEE|nr:phospholipase SGR2-like isoform X4 [Olea europaea var. sylvestris]